MFRPAIGSTVRDANDIPFTVVRAGMPVDCDHTWIWLGASYTLKTKQRGSVKDIISARSATRWCPGTMVF